MISPKGKMRVRLAVKDYQEMFAEEYRQLVLLVESQRSELINDMAELKGTHALKRRLSTISETLYQMIMKKLDEEDRLGWTDKDVQRWFCKEFPQFRVSKEI